MKLAIIGSGISGLTAAFYLHKIHDISVFEKGDYVGGHTNTINMSLSDGMYPVDTGFIVHNDRTYPNFIKLLKHLDVQTQDTEMSFSVKDEVSGLEYNGGNLNKIFAQRSNLLRPRFYLLLREILRFNATAKDFLLENDSSLSLGDFLKRYQFSEMFMDKYLVPMGASIWSTVPSDMLKYPADAFLSFFLNHGLLDLQNRPQWRTIQGGSREYVKKITSGFQDRIHLNQNIQAVDRLNSGTYVHFDNGEKERFDGVILATHSDQALQILNKPSPEERRILSAIPYQKNVAILHTDAQVLPKRRLAWASWNYHLTESSTAVAALTYNMNILQDLKTKEVVNVTLNHKAAIDPNKIHAEIIYHHPLFTQAGISAQKEKHLISGVNNTWFCGAFWRHGFHEDGVVSALDVVKQLGGTPL